MPIYEYYCRDNHTIYQFYAKTLAQGRTTPKCPDNPRFKLEKTVSAFAVTSGGKKGDDTGPIGGGEDLGGGGAPEGDDPRMEAAMNAMEGEFAGMDENDPRAMGRMMRRMAEMTGEKIDGEMEEVVRKLEEGADPETLEEQMGAGGGDDDADGMGPGGPPDETAAQRKERRYRFKARTVAPRRDPTLHDYA